MVQDVAEELPQKDLAEDKKFKMGDDSPPNSFLIFKVMF